MAKFSIGIIRMAQVQQWSGCIKKKGINFEINLKKIISLVKVVMGELSGLPGLLNDLDGTLMLTCDSSSSRNHFVKVDVSQCGTRLLGVSFYSTSKELGCAGINYYKTELNCKMISADVSQSDEEQITMIKEYFNSKFNLIVTPHRPNKQNGLCVATPIPVDKSYLKEYIITPGDNGKLETTPTKCMHENVLRPGMIEFCPNQNSPHTSEDGSDASVCEGEAECQAPPSSPSKH